MKKSKRDFIIVAGDTHRLVMPPTRDHVFRLMSKDAGYQQRFARAVIGFYKKNGYVVTIQRFKDSMMSTFKIVSVLEKGGHSRFSPADESHGVEESTNDACGITTRSFLDSDFFSARYVEGDERSLAAVIEIVMNVYKVFDMKKKNGSILFDFGESRMLELRDGNHIAYFPQLGGCLGLTEEHINQMSKKKTKC